MLLAFGYLLALSVSPELHHRVHEDSGDAHHECAITAFHQGVTVDIAPPRVTETSSAFIELPQLRPASFSGREVEWFSSGRAPPVRA